MRRSHWSILLLIGLLQSLTFGQGATTAPLEDYTRKLRLSAGLVMFTSVYNGHDSSGRALGDYDSAGTITEVTPDGFSSSWSMTYPANSGGHAFFRFAQQSHKVSIYSWADGPPAGYCPWDRLSDAIYQDLKAGKTTAFEFDGTVSDSSIHKVGEEDLTVLVNEHKVSIHTLRGQTPKGWTLWILDNPQFPAIVKMNSNFVSWVVHSFSLPQADRELVTQLQAKGIATTHNILFAFNSATLNDQSKPLLDSVANYLKQNPDIRLEIEGHTDNVGSAQVNLDLSGSRAQSVKNYLVQQGGIGSNRLSASGRGMTMPVADNKTPEGRALNRRVVFREVGRR